MCPVDPRFDIGSESNCSTGLCCRFDARNTALGTDASNPSIPASRYGDYLCDSPPDLALSAFADMRKNAALSNVAFSIFTGDIVSHDQTDQESRALTEYEERVAYETFKAQLGTVPVYATLGNHVRKSQAIIYMRDIDQF
jgi:sphingomyelin phosphodiesterase